MNDQELRDRFDSLRTFQPPRSAELARHVRLRARQSRRRRRGAAGAVLALVGAGLLVIGVPTLPVGRDTVVTTATGEAARQGATSDVTPEDAATAADLPVLVTPDGLLDLATGRRTVLPRVEQQHANGPTALASADGRYVLSTSVTDGTPVLRRTDTRTGRSSLYADRAKGMAWAGTGPVAYSEVDEPYRSGGPYLGRVVVRQSLDASPVAWTSEPHNDSILAWAGPYLLISRSAPDVEPGGNGELLVLNGPSSARSLGGTLDLIALSPDGRLALLTGSDASMRLVELSSGGTLATVPRPPGFGSPVGAVGSWTSDGLVIRFGSALAVYRGSGTQLRLEASIEVPDDLAPFLGEAQLRDGGREVLARSVDRIDRPDRYTLITCVVATGSCSRRELAQPVKGRQVSLLHNPSRPVAAGPD